MTLLAFGINHKTAPVDIRGKVAFVPEKLSTALKELTQQTSITEAAIVSTCNRTELYCGGLADDDLQTLIDWFSHYHHLPVDDVKPYIYVHTDSEAVQHILRVASGLDSLVLGEHCPRPGLP